MFGQKKEDMRVADYVLGLMDAEESAFFEREMREDRTLARRVADWRDRVKQIDDNEPSTPHAEMRRRIEAQLKGRGDNILLHPTALREPTQHDLPSLLLIGLACFAAGLLLGGTLFWLIFR